MIETPRLPTIVLEIVTRHWPTAGRRANLAEQYASLQTCDAVDAGWQQTVLVDPHGRGIPSTYARLRRFTPSAPYIWILDDDDRCVWPGIVAEIRACLEEARPPDALIFQMDHGPLGVLPPAEACARGAIGVSAAIVSRRLWCATQHAFGAAYDGDYDWLAEVFALTTPHEGKPACTRRWYPRVASAVTRISNGAA